MQRSGVTESTQGIQRNQLAAEKTLFARTLASHSPLLTLSCWFRDPKLLDVRARLNYFSQVREETEHFCRQRHQKVAKIVPYGLPRYDEGR
jgi:hypothetical protein